MKRTRPMRQLSEQLAELDVRDLTGDFSAIARKHAVTLSEIMGPERGHSSVTDARLECYYLLRERGWSYPRIGALFDRDHATVMEGVKSHVKREQAVRARVMKDIRGVA